MVEPLFRYEGELVPNTEISLAGAEGHHAASVRRLKVGEAVALTNGFGTLARGVVSAVESKMLSVAVKSVQQVARPKVRFGLVQALAKGDRDELAIQAATELGVAEVTPWQAERSVSVWSGEKQQKGLARWKSICDEASKQSHRSWFTEIKPLRSTKDLFKEISEIGSMWLVLDPTAKLSITEINIADSETIQLIVGPEGGISESELEGFEQAGAIRVHLGTGILRTSTAGVAALSYLAGKTGQWD